jgi:predicted nucleic acid-binding protein
MLVFVDTSAWVALGLRKDKASHARATSFLAKLKEEGAVMVTSDYVLDETFTVLMSRKVELDRIVLFKKTLETNVQAGTLRLVNVDDDIFKHAWAEFRRYYKHAVSFTDCTSYLIAKRIQADCIFSFDEHFRMMGLDVQP